MATVRSVKTNGNIELVVDYALQVRVFAGLSNPQLCEIGRLLETHASPVQLVILRAQIDAMLREAAELDQVVEGHLVLEDMTRRLAAGHADWGCPPVDSDGWSIAGKDSDPPRPRFGARLRRRLGRLFRREPVVQRALTESS